MTSTCSTGPTVIMAWRLLKAANHDGKRHTAYLFLDALDCCDASAKRIMVGICYAAGGQLWSEHVQDGQDDLVWVHTRDVSQPTLSGEVKPSDLMIRLVVGQRNQLIHQRWKLAEELAAFRTWEMQMKYQSQNALFCLHLQAA